MSNTTWRGPSRRSARRASRSLSLYASIAASSVALAGCGGESESTAEPRIPHATAERLAQRAELVADALDRGDGCAAEHEAAQLVEQSLTAVNAGEVPPPLQEELLGTAQDVAARIECAPPPPPAPAGGDEKDDDKDDKDEKDEKDKDEEGDGEGKGNGKGRGNDKKDGDG